jgi:hypothetical protein
MRRDYLSRKQVAAIMKRMYGEDALVVGVASGGTEKVVTDVEPTGDSPPTTTTTIAIEPETAETEETVAEVPDSPSERPPTPTRFPDRRERVAREEPRRRDPSTPVVHGGSVSSMVDQLRAERTIRVGWIFWPIAFTVTTVAIVTAGLVLESLTGSAGAAVFATPTIVASKEIERLVSLETPEWVESDGSGEMVLTVGYRNLTELTEMPSRIEAHAVYRGAIVETIVVAVPMTVEVLQGLDRRLSQPLLGPGGLLRDAPGGLFVLRFADPNLVETVILDSGQGSSIR